MAFNGGDPASWGHCSDGIDVPFTTKQQKKTKTESSCSNEQTKVLLSLFSVSLFPQRPTKMALKSMWQWTRWSGAGWGRFQPDCLMAYNTLWQVWNRSRSFWILPCCHFPVGLLPRKRFGKQMGVCQNNSNLSFNRFLNIYWAELLPECQGKQPSG